MSEASASFPDPQDKKAWVEYGVRCEERFLAAMADLSHVVIKQSPERIRGENKAVDFFIHGWGYCDLKTQNKPFFLAQKKFGIDPNKAVTFNHKDYVNYTTHLEKGLDVGLFFWVEWKTLEAPRLGSTSYRWGVYFMRFSEIKKIIDDQLTVPHHYNNRKGESGSHFMVERKMNQQGNAQASYVLSVDWMQPILNSSKNPWL